MYSGKLRVSAVRRFAALVCAAAYLAGGTEVLPAALALNAWLEGSHTIRMARSGDQVKIVLSHERGLPGRPGFSPRHQPGSKLHRHGVGARVLCTFGAQPSQRADHIASFAATSVCESPARVIGAKGKGVELATADLVALVSAAPSCLPTLGFARAISACSRPLDLLRFLRSTVLVI